MGADAPVAGFDADHEFLMARGEVDGDKGVFVVGKAGRCVDADPDNVVEDVEGGWAGRVFGHELLEYFEGEDGLVALLLDAGDFRVKVLAGHEVLLGLAARGAAVRGALP